MSVIDLKPYLVARDIRDCYGSDAPILPRGEPQEQPFEGLPIPGITEPIHLLALRGELPAGTCNGCGEPVALHFETSGAIWIGCLGAQSRRRLGLLTTRSLREVQVWGDAHPVVSEAIRDVLQGGCGEAVSAFYDGLSPDARLHLSRRLAEIAVIAFRKAEAGR